MLKSTFRVMPAILDAPGSGVSTSNNRDVVDAYKLTQHFAVGSRTPRTSRMRISTQG